MYQGSINSLQRLGKALRMPGRNALCWCLGGSAPPEISYGLENGGMTLKPIEVDLPMPQDEEELNAMFAELVDELDLDKPHREAMFNLPPEKKWQIYCSKKKDQDDPKSASWPAYYIEQINTMSKVFFTNDEDEILNRAKLVDNFKTALRTQPMSFVVRFIEQDGLQCLVDFLGKMDEDTASSPIHTAVIGCIKALMNNTQGRSHVLAHLTCINVIAQSLASNNIKAKVAVLEILGAVCLVPGGHRKALQAMLHYQSYAHERTRFQTLLIDLECTSGIYKNDEHLKTAIMSFVNAMLKYGPGQNHVEFRLHLRYELLMLGIMPVLEKLRKVDNPTLHRHIEFFEMVRNEDEKELAKKFDINHVDSKSASAMFDLLRKKLHYTAGYPHFLSILFHLLQLPFGNNNGPAQQWMLIDKIIQQIILQNKEGDPDLAPLELDVKKIVKQLANENEMKNIQTKMREIQKENDELASKLAKRERECEAKAEEKDELINTMNHMSSKLEKEALNHAEAKARVEELEQQLNDLRSMMDLERNERLKLEHAVNTGSLPDDAKVGLSSAKIFASASAKFASVAPPGPAPPPPPPPPGPCAPPGMVPPPPPPVGGGMFSNLPGFAVKKKNIPKPSHPLKSFNWAKLPDNKLNGTIWKDIDEMRLYQALDLAEFEQTFSAYQQGSETELFSKAAVKAKELSVIDGRRAQNCTILLSKLKMTNSELANAVLHMDPQEDLPKDMCEQLLKFIPTVEETQLLAEHEHEIEQMAKADRFLFEMSKIEHYEQRLKALYYKKKFSERMAECKPKVESVLNASKEVPRSRRLKKLMEIVLAFGNYMNRGNRGNASGYRVSSLNKIIDTKSSIDKGKTLMHYLVETVAKRFPDLLQLEEDLSHVKAASKVNMTELDAEINVLRAGLKEIEKELDYYKKKGVTFDKFVSVMRDFITVASYNFSELEETVAEMKQKFEKLAKLLAEDPQKSQPNELFGEFDRFIMAYNDAHTDNKRYLRQRQEEEKRAAMETQLRAEKQRRGSQTSLGRERVKNGRSESINEEKGEFDDLISALRTGDVFSEDMAKLKRTRRRQSAPKVETVRRPSVPKITETCRERTGKF